MGDPLTTANVFLQALSAAIAARPTEAAGFLLAACGKGTVLKPLPFSNAKVRTAAH
jgi:hypothetical protein